MSIDLTKYSELVSNNPCYLASVTNNDVPKPNLSVVEDVRVIAPNKMLISHNQMRQTIMNLLQNNNLVVVVLDQERRGVRLTGSTEYYTYGAYFQQNLDFFKNENTHPKGTIVFTVDKIEEME